MNRSTNSRQPTTDSHSVHTSLVSLAGGHVNQLRDVSGVKGNPPHTTAWPLLPVVHRGIPNGRQDKRDFEHRASGAPPAWHVTWPRRSDHILCGSDHTVSVVPVLSQGHDRLWGNAKHGGGDPSGLRLCQAPQSDLPVQTGRFISHMPNCACRAHPCAKHPLPLVFSRKACSVVKPRTLLRWRV